MLKITFLAITRPLLHVSGVTTDPADPAMRGRGAAGLWVPKIMALVFVTVNLTQQFCADVH